MIGFSSDVSATYYSVCSPACSYWASGDIVYGLSVRVDITTSVGPKDFSAFTQDTEISWDVDKLYSTIFFSINEGTGA